MAANWKASIERQRAELAAQLHAPMARLADRTIYLRAASINIFNGMVSLTFSCDGSHYLSYADFLDRKSGFWLGIGG